MTDTSSRNDVPGRLALRVEGNWWVAYYAKPDTMDGAIELGRILMGIVRHEAHKQEFMELMKGVIGSYLNQIVGQEPTWSQESAPEHERSGRG